MKTEEYNLREEIKEEVEKALKSGIDNEHCGVFRVIREEQYSPRGKAIILNNGIYEKIISKCNLCRACEVKGSNLCGAFLKARQVLVLQEKESEGNKRMIANIKSKGIAY